MTFITMKYFGVDANVVALSGIAIAIGVMVDVGIVFVENIVRHLEMEENHGAKGAKLLTIVYDASVEVAFSHHDCISNNHRKFLTRLCHAGFRR